MVPLRGFKVLAGIDSRPLFVEILFKLKAELEA